MASRDDLRHCELDSYISLTDSLIRESFQPAVDYSLRRGEEPNEWVEPIENFKQVDLFSPVYDFYEAHCKIDRMEFERNSRTVTSFLRLLLKAMRQEASNIPGIRLSDYVPQGSSKEGLKVGHAIEFDAIFPIEIEGIELKFLTHEDDRQNISPGFAEIHTRNPRNAVLVASYEKLSLLEKVSDANGGTLAVSSKAVHATLFRKLLTKAINTINLKINRKDGVSFGIELIVRPPTLNVTLKIKLAESTETLNIDMDVVPGILIDKVPSPETPYCRRYAVCCWMEPSKAAAQRTSIKTLHLQRVWRISHAGFERYIIERCRGDPTKEYLCTACRILKCLKDMGKELPGTPLQFCTVIKSYHLKTVLMYAILFVTVTKKKIGSVCEALTYLVEMIKFVLVPSLTNACCLPSFFLGNFYSKYMFIHENSPSSAFYSNHFRMNLFRKINKESLNQASRSMSFLIEHFNFKISLDMQKRDLDQKWLEKFHQHINESRLAITH